ncbi:hypothetical protein NPIL_349891 [Nephila pilipes]|uniref:Uncharacterized protein n=1 Tax=Nephila pilipes TaxID=299642 RepID=A0A8X6QGD1_NEPPI|nr:hypothetical protein NPIL_349891 [Nephila pilipes]
MDLTHKLNRFTLNRINLLIRPPAASCHFLTPPHDCECVSYRLGSFDCLAGTNLFISEWKNGFFFLSLLLLASVLFLLAGFWTTVNVKVDVMGKRLGKTRNVTLEI